jgi:hypothetical protein
MKPFTIQDVHPSLRHPTDPTLFKVSEGTYETADYVSKVCRQVQCTFDLWQGNDANGRYAPAPPVVYENITREEAFTQIIYALNTRDPAINRLGQRYSNVHTQEVNTADNEKRSEEG